MSGLFTLGILLISAIVILIPTLMGIKRGNVKAGAKLAASVLAAFISFVICKASIPKMKVLLMDFLKDMVSSEESLVKVVEALEEGSVLMSLAVGIVAAIVIPFAFVALYSILNIITGIIANIVVASLMKKNADLEGKTNFGWAIGLVHGILSLVIIMMPIVGVVGLVTPFASVISEENEAYVQVNDSYSQDSYNYNEEYTYSQGVQVGDIITSIGDSVPLRMIGAIGSRPLYKALTSFRIDGVKISMLDEAETLAECYNHLESFFGVSIKNYSSKQAEALRLLGYDLQQSELTMLLVSDILPDMSQKWLDNKSFLGMGAPSLGTDLEPLKNSLLEITSEMNHETVKQDMSSVFEIVAIVFDHETLGHMGDTRSLMENISTKGYISQLLAVTYENERMSPLVVEITNLGIRAVGTTLKIPENNEAVYDELMKDICAIVNKTSSVTVRDDRQKEIYDSLEVSFTKAGVETSEDERAVIAYYLIDQFGARDDISHGEIEEFFESVSDGFDKVENTSYRGKAKFVFTSSKFEDLSDKIWEFYSGNSNLIIKIKTDDGYACIESTGDTVLVTRHSVDESGNHVVDTYEADVTDKKSVFSNLSSSKDFECEGKTIEKMLLKSTEGIDDLSAEEALAEFENLENGITKIVDFINKVDNSNSSKMDASSVEMLGDALQNLSSNKLLGSTGCDFIEGTLKSEFVQGKVDGLDSEVVDDVMVNLRNEDGNADPDFSLGNTLASGVQAAELVTQLGKDNGESDEPNEEVEKSLSWLIENMSPTSAKTICKMITPEFIRGKGLTNGDLNHVSDMLKELFMQMAESDAMSEQEYKNESKAIQNLYNMMVKATSDGAKSMFGEDSGTTAESVINNYMSSKVVSNTVYTHAFKNGELKIDFLCFGSKSMRADDKEKLAKAAKEYYLENKDSSDPMFKDKLKALAAMLCIEIDFDENGVTYSFPETPGMNPLEYKDGKYTYTVNGKLVKGWTEINGKLYYFDSKGYAAIGWTTIKSETYYFTAETGARTGIVSIDDVLYAFDANGALTEIIG